MRLPRTLYLWLIALALTYALPPLLVRIFDTRPGMAAQMSSKSDGSLSSEDFEKYVTAEMSTHVGLTNLGGGLVDLSNQKQKSLREAAHTYRDLAAATHVPNMSRRYLILHHAQGKPFDEAILRDRLVPDLRAAGVGGNDIDAESDLWRSLYNNPAEKRWDEAAVADGERRIRAMHLRFLEDRALADLYRAAGQTARAEAALARMDRGAVSYTVGQGALGLWIGLGGLVGLVLLIVFLIAAGQNAWYRVGRVATAPLRLGWGDLLDAFVFYLALFKAVGLAVSIPLERFGTTLGPRERLMAVVIMEVGVGLGAGLYVRSIARKRGATLADIGLTTGGNLVGNIGYGIVGYFTAMPLLFGLGALAKLIFKHNANTAPNPVIPLITGIHDPAGRFLLFLLASVCAPLFEEFFFRGVLFSGLRTRYNWVVSGLITSVCFAMLHPIQDWLPIFGLGFALATMREMRQSLVPGMVTHFLQNTVTFVTLSLLFR